MHLQLPPVSKRESDSSIKRYLQVNENVKSQILASDDTMREFCFQSSAWNEIITKTFLLTQVFRQNDIDFINVLNAIRIGQYNNEIEQIFSKCINRQLSSDDGILPTIIFTHR